MSEQNLQYSKKKNDSKFNTKMSEQSLSEQMSDD